MLQDSHEVVSVPEYSSQEVVVGKENLVLTLVSQGTSSEGVPVPLNRVMPDQSNVSSWVLLTVKEIQQFVWMGCEGFEDQFLALHTAIESSHAGSKKSASHKQRGAKEINMFH